MPLPLHSILANEILLKITACKRANACFLWSWVLTGILAGVVGNRYVACVLLLWAAYCLSAWVSRKDDGRLYDSAMLVLDFSLLDATFSWYRGHVKRMLTCNSLMRLLPDMCTEALHLLENHLSHLRDILNDFKSEIKGSWAIWLIRSIMPDVEVTMLESFFNRDTRARIECQHAIKQIQCVGIRIGEQSRERHLGHEWQIADVLLSTWASNA